MNFSMSNDFDFGGDMLAGRRVEVTQVPRVVAAYNKVNKRMEFFGALLTFLDDLIHSCTISDRI